LRNAGLKSITKNFVEGPRRNITQEEWLLAIATEVIGTRSFCGTLHHEDVLSDVLLKLIEAHAFAWDEQTVVDFCKREARNIFYGNLRRKEFVVSEFEYDDTITDIIDRKAHQEPMQEINYMAAESVGLLRAIPDKHRAALEILIDGGNPIHVAEELRVSPALAMRLIREAREYVMRVDPSYD